MGGVSAKRKLSAAGVGILVLSAVVLIIAAVGCGGASEETFREHQVKKVVHLIEFQDALLTNVERPNMPAGMATRYELRSFRIAFRLEHDVEPAILEEACKQVEQARICGGNGLPLPIGGS